MQPVKYATYSTNPSDGAEVPGELKPPNIGDDFEATVDAIVRDPQSNFKEAPRIKFSELTEQLFEQKVIQEGIPLVVEDVTKGWDRELFSWNWLKDNFGTAPMINSPRDTEKLVDLENWTVGAYVDYFLKPADKRPNRLYGKDVTCPEPWRRYLAGKLNDFFCYEHNDLVSDIDKELQPVTLMVYIGPEKVWTPGHKDICGSLGHNVMVYAEPQAYSMWFCIGRHDKDRAADVWKSCGGMLDHDNFFLAPEQLRKADCTIYTIKQREGDLVLVPPESPHQVINMGGRQIKVAWNRITASTIGLSYHNVLPLYHSMCKNEVYRIKTIAYYAMLNRAKRVERGEYNRKLLREFPPLLRLVDEITESEYVDPKAIKNWGDTFTTELFTDTLKHSRTCNYCNCDIFSRCYHCNLCKTDYDVCLDCVAETRGCVHNAQLKLMEYFSRKQIIISLKRSLDAYEKLCGIFKIEPDFIEKFTFGANHSAATLAYNFVRHNTRQNKVPCHQCKIAKKSQFIVRCNTCSFHYCAMCLWNRYAIKFVDASKDSVWTCPSCRKTCNCAACLRKRGLNPKEYSESVVAENNFVDVTVVLPPAFERSSEAVMGVNDVKPRGVTPSATAYSQQDIERKKLLRKLKLKEGETGPAVTDSPEVVSDEASQNKKRRGTKRKRSSVEAMIELEDDIEPKPKRRRTRELARELIEATDSTVTINALLALLKHPNADSLVKDVLNKYADEMSDNNNYNETYVPSSPPNDHDSVMLDLVALELKEIEDMRQEEERWKDEEEKRLKEEKEQKILTRRRSGRNSLENSTNNANILNSIHNHNNNNNNNVTSLGSSNDAAAVLEQGFSKSNEVKDEPDAGQTESTPTEDEGKRTRRGRKTSLPAKYADSVSLDTSVKLPQAPILNEDDDDEPMKETEKPEKKPEKEKEKEKEKETEKPTEKEKEKEKEPSTPVTSPRVSERRVSGRRKKSDVSAELEKQKQKKQEKEEDMKKLRAIFRHIDHVFNEDDFDDVVFIKMNGYPQWPAAVIKVDAEPRLPGRILRYKTPKRNEELRCVVFLCDPKAPYTWQPAYNFIPLDELNMQECTRALRLKLGVRLGESLEDAARLRAYLFPDRPDLLPYVHEFRKQYDPHFHPTTDPRPEAETTNKNNTNANGHDAESANENQGDEDKEKVQEPVKESERATRAKKRRSTTDDGNNTTTSTNTNGNKSNVPSLQAQAKTVMEREMHKSREEQEKKEAEETARLIPITATTTPVVTGRGGRRRKSQPEPEPVSAEEELPKTEPKIEPVDNTNAVIEVKPSTSSIESTDAQQTSSAESTTIDLTMGEVAGSARPGGNKHDLAVLNALLELSFKPQQ
jgi:hypothetical protein